MSGRTADERGQATADYIGVLAFAALVVIVVLAFVTPVGERAVEQVRYVLCQVANAVVGGSCDPPRSAEDRIPTDPCVVSSFGGGGQIGVSVEFVTLSSGLEVMIQQFGDGTYQVTLVDSDAVGLTASAGATVNVTIDSSTYGAGAFVGVDGLLASEVGQSWTVDSDGELEDLLTQLAGDEIADTVGSGPPGPLGVGGIDIPYVPDLTDLTDWGADELADLITGETPDPDSEWITGGVQSLGYLDVFSGPLGGTLDQEAFLGMTASSDGTATAFIEGEIDGQAAASLFPGLSIDVNGSSSALVEVDFDEDGTPTSLSLTSALTYGTDNDDLTYEEVKYEIPLTGDISQDAELVALALGSAANPLGDLDAFVEAAQEDGQITHNEYSLDPNEYGAAGAISAIPEILSAGVTASADFPEQSLESSQYWNGTEFVDNPSCEL